MYFSYQNGVEEMIFIKNYSRKVNLIETILYLFVVSFALYPTIFSKINIMGYKVFIGAIFLVLLYYLIVLKVFIGKKIFLNKTLFLSIIAILFSVALSCLVGIKFLEEYVIYLVFLLSIPIFFTSILKDVRILKVVMLILIISGFVLFLYGSYGYITGKIGEESSSFIWKNYARYFGLHYTPSTSNSDVYYFSIPLLLVFSEFLFNQQLSYWRKLLELGLIIILMLAVFLSFSRTAWISLLFVFLFGIYFAIKNRFLKIDKKFLISLISIIIIFSISSYALLNAFHLQQYFIGRLISILLPEKKNLYLIVEVSNEDRLNLLKAGFKIFFEHPLGSGIGSFRELSMSLVGFSANHPENTYLYFFAETGILGGLGFLVLIFKPVVYFLKNRKKINNSIIWGIMMISIYISISYFFDFEVYNMYHWFLISYIWSCVNLRGYDLCLKE
jgi:O-antigen ligase